ncbi:MAG: YkgJ family cysteine cluster protein [Candidatus Diapherotrites archaeon]|uniref:YkgJ family cysteine cluster protein n=1 Tax=Candidatus Iainarchaeum sp. TaxID=3101447 RepID=A0A8T3YRY1_9ARCH|nr:YkgJ family cysteine cluster protein [Candidatus Diapherotrites archaeon]
MYDFKCQRCGECCKRYYIISLPGEVSAQASLKGLEEGDFIARNMQLFLQLFPAEHGGSRINVSSSLVPRKFLDMISGHAGHIPEFFLALPMLAFRRREDGSCTFYDSGNSGCTIYSERPLECRLFPFVSDRKPDDYSKLYPFCHGLRHKDSNKTYADLSFVHFRQVADYFGMVKEKGFSGVWNSWPNGGVCLFTDKLLGPITADEFFGVIAPYK